MKALLFVGALAVSAMTIVPTVASAEVDSDGRLVATVGYSDLDLNTAAGKARLDKRIKAAIRQVCQRPSSLELAASADYNQCVAEARVATKKSVALALKGTRGKARRA